MGMPSLPDVDQQSYDDYQGQKFDQYATNQIEGFGFEHAASALISGLGNFKDQLAQTFTPSPPPPPPPAPPPEPPPPPPEPQGLIQSAQLTGQPAQDVALGPATPPPPAAPSPSQDLIQGQMQPAGGGQPIALGPAAPSAPSVPSDQGQIAPAAPPAQPTRVFPVQGYNGQVDYHWGDVKGGSDLFAPRGTPVLAMQGGKVLESGPNSVGGNAVLIQGDDGNQYYYAHLDAAPSVRVDQMVPAGTYLGPVGDTGDAKGRGTHLHIGIGPDIKLGADKYGGTGGDYDAVSMLRDTLAGKPTAPLAAEPQTTSPFQVPPGVNAVPSVGSSGLIPASTNIPINKGPTISRDQAEAAVAGTPLQGLGGTLWDLGIQYNVDPSFALSVARNESNYGSSAAQARNNNIFDISNAAYGGTPVAGSRWGQYPDKQTAIEAFYKLISQEYYPKGQDTVGSVMWGNQGNQQHAYAPLSENAQDYPLRLVNAMKDNGTTLLSPGSPIQQVTQVAGQALGAAGQAIGGAASSLGSAVSGALGQAGQAAYSLGSTAQDVLGNLVSGAQRPAYSLSSLEDLLTSGNPLGSASQAAYSLGSELGTQALSQSGLVDQLRQLQPQRSPLETVQTAAQDLGTSASSLLDNAISDYQPVAQTLGQRARDVVDYLNSPQSVTDLVENGPMPAVRQALVSVGQGLTGGRTYDLADVLNAPYTARMAAGQAIQNLPTSDLATGALSTADWLSGLPVSGLARLGTQTVGDILRQPGVLDSLQTLTELESRYGTRDATQMSPADQQAYQQALVGVGGIETPEIPENIRNLVRGLPTADILANTQERFLQGLSDAAELRTTPAGANDIALTAAQVEQHATGLRDLAARLEQQATTVADTAPERAATLQQQADVVRSAEQQIATAPPDTSFYMPRPSTAGDVRPSSVVDVRQAVPPEVRNGQQQVAIERLAEPVSSVEAAVPNERLAHTAMPEGRTATPTLPATQALAEPRTRVQPLNPAVERAAAEARRTDGVVPSVMPEGAIGVLPPKPASTANLATRIVRQITDKNVDLNQLQDLAEKNAANEGRKLGADEMAAYLARAQSEPAAQVRVQQLQAIVRDVGIDAGHLDDLLKLRSNIQVAAAVGERVTAEQIAANAPQHLADELRAASSSLNMRQRQLDLAQANEIPEADRIRAAQTAVRASQRRVDRAQKAIDDWQQANQAAAGRAGQQAAAERMFAGGMNAEDSVAAINQMRAQLGPARFAKVENAADQVSEYTRDLRNRLVTSQVFSPEMAAEFERRYPDWIKTEVIRYMNDDTPAGMQAGTKLGLSDNSVRAYTKEGSAQAVHSPLLSIEKYTYQVEKMAMKNEAALAFRKIASNDLRQISSDYKLDPKNETAINLFQNGTKQRYLTTNKWVGETINGAGVADVPEWAKAWTDLFRMFATGRNPLFLSANAINDAAEYLIRTAAAEGGPHHALGIMGTLFKTYGDTFQGLLTGEFRGSMTQAYLQRGGGMATGFFRGVQAAGSHEEALSRLAGGPLIDLNSPQGIKNFVTSFLKFRWVEHIGERIELAPHVAAYSRALGRGENEVRAMIRGRDVTLDFARGGAAVKYVNNFIPFFNASVQGSAQLVRMARDNPVAATTTLVTLIGVPTALAELWDRGYNPDGSFDDQRARDYQDVPQYEKDRGVVVMLPGEAPTDQQGNRRPNYVTVNLRNFAVFSTMARDIVARAMGDETRGAGETGLAVAKAQLPYADPEQFLGSLARPFPGVSTAAQLAMNRDLYRNRYIVSNRADQNASAVAKAAAGAAQPVADALTGGTVNIRPSAIDFAIQNEGAGLGSSLLGGGTLAGRGIRTGINAVTGQDEPLPEDVSAVGVGGVPLVGGLAGRFVRNQTGQMLQTEGEESLTPSARSALRASGVTYQPGPVANSIQNVPLLQTEQAQYQRLANRYVDDEIQRLVRTGTWERLPVDERDRLAQQAVQRGRLKAAQEVMRTISPARRQAVARARLPLGAA